VNTTTKGHDATATALVTTLPAEIDALMARPVPGCAGVTVKELWRSGDLHDALIIYRAGTATPGCPHPGADHHIWLIRGTALIDGQRVEAGSYVHVPSGAFHPILAIDPAGCVLLQMHRPVTDGGPG
jgi:hypothetical protein